MIRRVILKHFPGVTDEDQAQNRVQSAPLRPKKISNSRSILFLSLATIGFKLVSASDTVDVTIDNGGSIAIDEDTNTCMLYMAESSIPNSGYGIFTVRAIQEGDYILEHDGPNIAVTDIREEDYEMELFDNVWWGPHGGMCDHMLYEAPSTYDFQIMFGALPNYHPHLWNLDFDQPDHPFDDSVADRSTDPGAGAFTYYTGKHFKASKRIEAGQEIFLDYGDKWLKNRGSAFEHIPRKPDYKQAGKTLSEFPNLLSQVGSESTVISKATTTHVESILQTIRKTLNSVEKLRRVESLIPKSIKELRKVVQAARDYSQEALSDAVALELTVEKRDLSWIRQNGMCLDNILPAKSHMEHAGHGAFARRPLGAGEMIVPVPLLHVPDRDMFKLRTLYEKEDEEGKKVLARHKTERKGWQLLLNYCWGHSDSSLLLCPVTNSVLINHCSNRKNQCGEKGPNAEYQWAKGWDPNTEGSLKKTVEELAKATAERVLSMEIVALRDIDANEEITMDYGEEWEEAWEAHLLNWKPPDGSGPLATYHSIAQMNEDEEEIDLIVELRTEDTPRRDGYFTACWYSEEEEEEEEQEDSTLEEDESTSDWTELSDEQIFSKYAVDGSDYIYWGGEHGAFWPCGVVAIDRSDMDDPRYTVRIFPSDFHDEPLWVQQDKPRILTNYPRGSIKYFTMPYRSDQHLPNAFRHHIEIRPDMFAEQWKNRPRTPS